MPTPRLAAVVAWLFMASCSSSGGRCSSPNHDAASSANPHRDAHDRLVVDASLPGASESEIATELTDPIEASISKCDGIASIHGFSDTGRSQVVLFAKPDVDSTTLRECVRDHLEAARRTLPENIELPLIRSRNDTVVALVTLRDARRSLLDLHAQADEVRKAVDPVSGVTETRTCGPEPAIVVTVDPMQLRSHGVGMKAVIDAFQNRSTGNIVNATKVSIEALQDLVIASPNNVPIKIRDLATLALDGAPGGCRAADLNGEAVVTVEVDGSESAGGLLDAALAPLRSALPVGTTMTIQRTRDLAKVAAARVDTKDHVPTPKSSDVSGVVLDSDGRDGVSPTIVWLSAAKKADASWLVDLVSKLTPSSDWTPIAIEAPSAGASAKPLWVALATTAECTAALPKLHDALAQRAVPGSVRDVGQGTRANGPPQLTVEIDRERAADLGVPVFEIAQSMRAAVSNIPVMDMMPPVLIRLKVPEERNAWVDAVDVSSEKGGSVPLASVIRMHEEPAAGPLLRLDRENVVVVFALLKPGIESPDKAWVQSKIDAPSCRVIQVGSGEW